MLDAMTRHLSICLLLLCGASGPLAACDGEPSKAPLDAGPLDARSDSAADGGKDTRPAGDQRSDGPTTDGPTTDGPTTDGTATLDGASPPPLPVRVLVLRYLPAVGANLDPQVTKINSTLSAMRSKIVKLTDLTAQALTAGSAFHGTKDPAAAPSLTYSIVEHKERLEPVPVDSPLLAVVDGDATTGKWQATAPYAGDFLQLDLGGPKTLSQLTLSFWGNDRPERYHLDLSPTGAFAGEETRLVSETAGLSGYQKLSAGSPIEQKTYSFTAASGRYLRLTIDQYRASGSETGQSNLYEIAADVPLSGAQVTSNEKLPAAPADHLRMLQGSGFDICDYVDNQGVKEVWVWMYHTDEVYPVESYQRGPGHQFGNGVMKLPLCGKSYTVYDYNYGRGLGEALEDHTHHVERTMAYLDNHFYWDLFSGGSTEVQAGNKTTHHDNPQAVYRCGWTHCPPNVLVADCAGTQNQLLDRCTCLGYDWTNERQVLSDCEDWRPGGGGATKAVDCTTWKDAFINPDRVSVPGRACPNDGGVGFKVWWLQNIPGRQNGLSYQGKAVRDFWGFVGDFDGEIAKGRCLTDPC